MKLLKDYQDLFFKNNFIEKIRKEKNNYLDEIIKRSNYLLDDKIIYTDSMDMETCFTPYELNKYKWATTPNDDLEWCFMLSRHGFTLDLAISYIITSDIRYLEKWKELVFSFIRENGNNKINWRPLDAGLRLSFWIRSIVYLGKDKFTNDEWQELMLSTEEHKNYLEKTFVPKYLLSNWGVLALGGMILYSLFNDENIDMSFNKLIDTVDLQFTNLGTQWEQSPLYHHEVILNYAIILQVSEILDKKLPIDLRKILKRLVKSAYYMCDKKDYLLALNDSDYVNFSYVYDFYRGMGLLEDKIDDLECKILLGDYYLEKLKDYKKINYNEVFFDNEAGFYALKDKDYYLTCFNGLHGSSHGQASQGSFTFSYKDKLILMDTGRYSYTECEERINLNKEISHNTLTLEHLKGTKIKDSWGYESLLEPISMQEVSIKNINYIEMTYLAKDKQYMTLFRRNIFLIKDMKAIVIIDDVKKNVNQKNLEYFHFVDIDDILIYTNGEKEIYDTYHSPRYNELDYHKAIKISKKDTIVTVISLDKNLKIEEIPVFQNNKEELYENCKGIKLIKDDNIKEIYVNISEIVKNDKLLVGDKKHLFYGSVVIFENDKRIRIK